RGSDVVATRGQNRTDEPRSRRCQMRPPGMIEMSLGNMRPVRRIVLGSGVGAGQQNGSKKRNHRGPPVDRQRSKFLRYTGLCSHGVFSLRVSFLLFVSKWTTVLTNQPSR